MAVEFKKITGGNRLSIKDKMLNVFDMLEKGCEEDLASIEPKERMRLMLDIAKVLMPKSDVDAKDEKSGKSANNEGIKDYFGMKLVKEA